MQALGDNDSILFLFESYTVTRRAPHTEITIFGKSTFGKIRVFLTCRRDDSEPRLNYLQCYEKYVILIRNVEYKDGDDYFVESGQEFWQNVHMMVMTPKWTTYEGKQTLSVFQKACVFPEGFMEGAWRNVFPLDLDDQYLLADLKVEELDDYEVDF